MFGGRNMATLIIIKGDQEMGEIYYVIFACFKKTNIYVRPGSKVEYFARAVKWKGLKIK